MNKFTMMQFPAFTCQPDGVAIIFYAFVLPMIFLQMIGTSATIMLAMVLYNVSIHIVRSSVYYLLMMYNTADTLYLYLNAV